MPMNVTDPIQNNNIIANILKCIAFVLNDEWLLYKLRSTCYHLPITSSVVVLS